MVDHAFAKFRKKKTLYTSVGCGNRCGPENLQPEGSRTVFFSQVLQNTKLKALDRGNESIENILFSCETVCNAQPFTFVCLT